MKILRRKNRSFSGAKNVVLCLILTTAMLFGTGTQANAAGADSTQSDTNNQFDVAMVIDISGSMRHSDPHEYAKEGAKLFLDQTLRDDSQVFIISYGYSAKLLGKGRLSSNEDKERLKDLIDGITYPEKNGTDTGEALKLAQKTLEDYGEEDHQKCILLFTDGDVEWVTPDKEKNKTANAKSIEQCKEVSLWGDKNVGDCPLYILGLNAKGKTISSKGKTLIQTLASNSGGKSKVVTEPEQIGDFYARIFGEITSSNVKKEEEIIATGEWQSSVVDIPNSSVRKANITMFTSAKVTSVKMIDPSGQEKKFNTTDCVLSRENSYSIVELLNPVKGQWTIKFKAPKGTRIQPNFIFLYENMPSVLTVKAQSGDNKNAYINQPVNVEVYLKSNDTKVVDPDVYKDIKGTVRVINTDTDELAFTFDLAFDANKVLMTGSFTPDKFGTYKVTTALNSASFHRENGPTEIKVVDHKPELTGKIKDISLRVGKSETLRLTDYFKDTDGLGLTYQISSTGGKAIDAKADDAKGVLAIDALQKGKAKITVTASDPAGNQVTAVFNVKAKTMMDIMIPWMIGLILLLIAAAVALWLLMAIKRLRGYFYIERYTDSSRAGIDYGNDPISLNKGSRSVTLFSLVNTLARDRETYNGELTPTLREQAVSSVLSSIVLTGSLGKGNYTMTMSCGKKGKKAADVTLDGNDLVGKKMTITADPTARYKLVIKISSGQIITVRFGYTKRNR